MSMPPQIREGGSPPFPSTNQAALLVVDMQNAFCHPDGFFTRYADDKMACRRIVEPCARVIAAARKAGVTVLYGAKVSFTPDIATTSFHNAPRHGTGLMLADSWDAAVVDELKPAPGELVVEKLAYSVFFGTSLDVALYRLGIRQLVVIGVTTSICVDSTVRDAMQRGLNTYVVSDATAEWDAARHERAIEQLGYAFARILTVSDLEKVWGAAGDSR